MREAKNKGAHIGLPKGTSLTTKKSIECKAIIQKHSRDFGGSLEDPNVIKLCGCSRNSYYKYKKEIKNRLVNSELRSNTRTAQEFFCDKT
jgi:ACT domain-containing protein